MTILREGEKEVKLTYEEFVKLKDGIGELFEQRSEVYFTEKNEVIEAGELVMTILQNRFDSINPNLLM